MSRVTVTIDDALLDEAQEVLGAESPVATIRTALEEAVRHRRLAQALQQRGQLQLRGGLAERMAERKEAFMPSTALGRRFWSLRKEYIAGGGPLLTADEIDAELQQRRGDLGPGES